MSMPEIKPSDVNKCGAAAALVQSIALEETAISHILNAEGEKIQKVLSMHTCDCEDILKVNKSVEDMVEKITNLEIVLKAKLELIVPTLEDCEKCRKKDCGKNESDQKDCD